MRDHEEGTAKRKKEKAKRKWRHKNSKNDADTFFFWFIEKDDEFIFVCCCRHPNGKVALLLRKRTKKPKQKTEVCVGNRTHQPFIGPTCANNVNAMTTMMMGDRQQQHEQQHEQQDTSQKASTGVAAPQPRGVACYCLGKPGDPDFAQACSVEQQPQATEKKRETLQDAFKQFKQRRKQQIKQQKQLKSTQAKQRTPQMKERLRKRFLQQVKKYMGVPYHRKYHQDPKGWRCNAKVNVLSICGCLFWHHTHTHTHTQAHSTCTPRVHWS